MHPQWPTQMRFKDKFYDDLDSVISAAPRTDKLILLGDFSTKLGTDHQTWEGVIGVGKCNSNELLLLRKCKGHELLITNTVVRLPTRRKTSWMHSRSKHWHLIDYVIVRMNDWQDVRVTKIMCGADSCTDHRFVVSKLNLRIQPVWRPQGKKVPKRLDASKLKQDSKRKAFVKDICSRLDALQHSSEDEDESWTVFRDTVHSSAMNSLGPVSRNHQDWFDENDKKIQGLLEVKHQKHKTSPRNTSSVSSKAAYSNYVRQYRLGLETCKTPGWAKRLMKSNHLQTERIWRSSLLHSKIYGPQSSETTPILSADGTSLLTDKESILKKKWAEQFDGVLNRPSSINDEGIKRLPGVECNPLLDELPTLSETVKTIKLWSSFKAPGSDTIPAEIYEAGGPLVAEKPTELFHKICVEKKPSLKSWKEKNATIIQLFKRKGNPQVCDNHRCIPLLSVAGKILAWVLLNGPNGHLEQPGLLPESQCGFRKDRGTVDMIFTARQLQEKCQEQNVDL